MLEGFRFSMLFAALFISAFLFTIAALFRCSFRFIYSDTLGLLLLLAAGTYHLEKRKKTKRPKKPQPEKNVLPSEGSGRAWMLLGLFLAFLSVALERRGLVSFEWAFLGFVLAGLVYFFFSVDSRYLILPAIVLLFFCPFLLIYKLDSYAEAMAIYAYYFLVVGVVLQFIEVRWKLRTAYGFEPVWQVVKNSGWIYMLLIAAVAFTVIRLFFPYLVFFRAFAGFLTGLFLVLYLIQKLVD